MDFDVFPTILDKFVWQFINLELYMYQIDIILSEFEVIAFKIIQICLYSIDFLALRFIYTYLKWNSSNSVNV